MREDDRYDLDKLRADDTAMEGMVTRSAKNRRATVISRPGAFVRHPLELVYRMGAAKNIGTVKMLPLLLHLNWKASGKPFKLTNRALAQIGVSRRQKLSALRELEMLRFVRVEYRGRKSPEVTVLAPRPE
jgi:hypothetical protein